MNFNKQYNDQQQALDEICSNKFSNQFGAKGN